MIDQLAPTPAAMLSLSCVMLGICAVAVGARDWLGRWQWRGDGPLGWPLHRLSGGRLRQSSLAASLFAPQGIGALRLVRVAAGAALIVQPQAWALPAALLLLIIVQLLWSPRLHAARWRALASDPRARSEWLTRLRYGATVHQDISTSYPDRYLRPFAAARDLLADRPAPRILSFGCAAGEEVVTLRSYLSNAMLIGAGCAISPRITLLPLRR